MAKKSSINMSLPAADDLFSTQEQREEESREKVMDIPLEEISDFPNHPFKVKADENMMDMAESIKQYGVLVPAIVREKEGGGYEMVAGHRRKMASELAEKKEMPCIVRKLSDDEAILIMVDSNLQREQILPSEKAFAYKMKLEAMKRQAGRPSKNSVPVGQNFRQTSREILAGKSPDSNTQIQRFIRLTELVPPILDMVDENRIALRPAVELSYLPKEEQSTLFDTMQAEDCTPSHAQAIKLRKFSEEGKLNPEVMLSILAEEKPNQIEKFKIPMNRIEKYFPKGASSKQMEDTIVKA
ncbi:MAG: ParB/RepB/Spo0J family partition protein, partial [Lachnospiraceae bacterium]|nr:ParB/RepB/Spo0J family partition protein [Lachnospiraceae bacterium]